MWCYGVDRPRGLSVSACRAFIYS